MKSRVRSKAKALPTSDPSCPSQGMENSARPCRVSSQAFSERVRASAM